MEIKDGGILIIAAPRTGSTNLMKSIGSAYNKKERFEPDIVKKWPRYDSSNDVVKFVNGFNVLPFNIEPIDELKNVEL